MSKKIALLMVVSLFALTTSNLLFKKVVHNSDPFAKCLDGTSPALLISEGDPEHFLVYFMGGGFCRGDTEQETLQSCYERSKTQFGSSLYFPDTIPGRGMISADPSVSFMANWTQVFVSYCDGAFHQGYAAEPIKYKDTELYFRGGLNTWSHLKYLNEKYGLYHAKKVVLGGISAGAIAAYMWADQVKALLDESTDFKVIADSGIYLDINLDTISNDGIYKISNKDLPPPNQKCLQANPTRPGDCFLIQKALPHLSTTIFFIQSSYDQTIISPISDCLTEGVSGFSLKNCNQTQLITIETYRKYYLDFVQKQIIPRGHSIWSISCSWHSGTFYDELYKSDLQRVPMTTGPTMDQAAFAFVEEGKTVIQVDKVAWPGNAPCAM